MPLTNTIIGIIIALFIGGICLLILFLVGKTLRRFLYPLRYPVAIGITLYLAYFHNIYAAIIWTLLIINVIVDRKYNGEKGVIVGTYMEKGKPKKQYLMPEYHGQTYEGAYYDREDDEEHAADPEFNRIVPLYIYYLGAWVLVITFLITGQYILDSTLG